MTIGFWSRPSLIPDANTSFGACPVIDASGNLNVFYRGLTTDNSIWCSVYNGNTGQWINHYQPSAGGQLFCTSFNPTVAFFQGSIWLIWVDSRDATIVFSIYANGQWSSPQPVPGAYTAEGYLCTTIWRNILILFYDGTGNESDWTFMVATNDPTGNTWEVPVTNILQQNFQPTSAITYFNTISLTEQILLFGIGASASVLGYVWEAPMNFQRNTFENLGTVKGSISTTGGNAVCLPATGSSPSEALVAWDIPVIGWLKYSTWLGGTSFSPPASFMLSSNVGASALPGMIVYQNNLWAIWPSTGNAGGMFYSYASLS